METIDKNEPLLYIDQPTLRTPVGKMQMHFQSRQKQKNTNKEQRFKQLDLEGKLQYVLQIPAQLPPLKCDVITVRGSYRGIITEDHHDKIWMRLHNRKEVAISKDMMKDIHLVGF